MRALAIAVSLAVLAIAAAPTAAADAASAPPDLPPGHSGCNYFHYHGGNVLEGELPGYHYHNCY